MTAALYTRVSTDDQTTEPQRLELVAFCARAGLTIAAEFSDTLSGSKASRPGLDALLTACKSKAFDVVVVVKLDRLGRSLLNVVSLIAGLDKLGIGLICTSQGIDTRKDSPAGRLILGVLASCAEFERTLIRERTKAGLANARAKGRKLGKPSKTGATGDVRAGIIDRWKTEQARGGVRPSYRELARDLGVSVSSAHRFVEAG